VNLRANSKAAVAMFKIQPPVGYQVKGTFQGFQTSGPMFDSFAGQVKEQLKLDIKGVGVIKVNEVYSAGVPNPGCQDRVAGFTVTFTQFILAKHR
jgi:hypothetical protein